MVIRVASQTKVNLNNYYYYAHESDYFLLNTNGHKWPQIFHKYYL